MLLIPEDVPLLERIDNSLSSQYSLDTAWRPHTNLNIQRLHFDKVVSYQAKTGPLWATAHTVVALNKDWHKTVQCNLARVGRAPCSGAHAQARAWLRAQARTPARAWQAHAWARV